MVLQHFPDGGLVQHTIRLGTGGPNRRPFTGVERPELDTGTVGGMAHGPAKRIDLFHQVALADTANGRVAGHLAQGLDVVRQQERLRPHACRRQCGLSAGMAATNDDDIVAVRVIHRTSVFGRF